MRTLAIILCILSLKSFAILPPPNNAVSLSLGGASATYLNSYALSNNVGVLAFCESEVAINGQNSFGLNEYSKFSFAVNKKTKLASIALGYEITPFSGYTHQKAQIGISKSLHEKVSAGVALNYHYLNSTNPYYQPLKAFTFNAGLYYKVNEKLNAGISIFNPNRSKLTDTPMENLASTIRVGIDYLIADNIKLYTDVLQSSNEHLDLNAGLELQKEKYFIRGGFGLNQLIALGFGWEAKKINIDVAGSYHNQLGFSPSLNLRYAF